MTVGMRHRNSAAIAAYQTQNLAASRAFHVNRTLIDEPHKTYLFNELK